MTAKEAIVQAVEDLPEDCLEDLAHYVDTLRQRAALRTVPTALASSLLKKRDWLRTDLRKPAKNEHREVPVPLFQQAASETVLAKDWLRPEKDEAWRDL